MTGNIEKINQVYNTDLERHSNLNDLILTEKSAGGILATDALLWLRRALHMILRFFELVLEDGSSEELVGLLKTAYRETLITYHKWPLQLLFSMLCRMCPNRSRLIQVMSLNRSHTEASVYRDLAVFTAALRLNVDSLAAFYSEHQLECENKVPQLVAPNKVSGW
ncbi:glycolipid transfer protein isoform X2 [Macrosteles quadrilineatus]|nr:glycolipid transfer protein isoform X2 [Macrosteles quadrilineatus]